MDALLYLRDILQDVTSQTTRITGINMRFRIMLEPSFTDDEGLVHLNWDELHPLFTHAVWTDIARALADLSHKSLKEFWITVPIRPTLHARDHFNFPIIPKNRHKSRKNYWWGQKKSGVTRDQRVGRIDTVHRTPIAHSCGKLRAQTVLPPCPRCIRPFWF